MKAVPAYGSPSMAPRVQKCLTVFIVFIHFPVVDFDAASGQLISQVHIFAASRSSEFPGLLLQWLCGRAMGSIAIRLWAPV